MPAAPQAPRATAYDVYSGMAEIALDNTGKNTVSRDAFGNTTVTNQHGATTAMTPGGYEAAYGGVPGSSIPGGSLPGIKGPDMGKFGQAVKGALPGIGGGLLGTAVAGPLGGMIGAALAKAVTQPGGVFSKQNNFATEWIGNITTNKPQSGGAFPRRSGGGLSASQQAAARSRDMAAARGRSIAAEASPPEPTGQSPKAKADSTDGKKQHHGLLDYSGIQHGCGWRRYSGHGPAHRTWTTPSARLCPS